MAACQLQQWNENSNLHQNCFCLTCNFWFSSICCHWWFWSCCLWQQHCVIITALYCFSWHWNTHDAIIKKRFLCCSCFAVHFKIVNALQDIGVHIACLPMRRTIYEQIISHVLTHHYTRYTRICRKDKGMNREWFILSPRTNGYKKPDGYICCMRVFGRKHCMT